MPQGLCNSHASFMRMMIGIFALTAGQKRQGRSAKDRRLQGVYRKLVSADWTVGCQFALEQLKTMLFQCVVFAHPDFNEPFILSVDASLDGLGAVLSYLDSGGQWS